MKCAKSILRPSAILAVVIASNMGVVDRPQHQRRALRNCCRSATDEAAEERAHYQHCFGLRHQSVCAPSGTVYCATKAAVRTLTEGLRTEVHVDGIRTTISPGAVDSELKASTSDEASSKAVKELNRTWPFLQSPLLEQLPTPSSNQPTWKSAGSSSGPRRRNF